jgi:hypothetical protein
MAGIIDTIEVYCNAIALALLLSADRDFIGELPEWLKRLSTHLKQWLPNCDQVLVNEYLPGQKFYPLPIPN